MAKVPYAEKNPAVFGLPVRDRTQTGKREVILSLYLAGEETVQVV